MSIEDTLEAMRDKLERDVAELACVRSNVKASRSALEPTPGARAARLSLEIVEILLGECCRHLKTSAELVGEIDVNAEPPSEPETPAEIACRHRLPASLAGSYEEHGSGKIEVPEWAKALK